MGGGKAEAREKKSDFSLNWKGHRAAERGRWKGRRPHPVVAGTEKELTKRAMWLFTAPRRLSQRGQMDMGHRRFKKWGIGFEVTFSARE